MESGLIKNKKTLWEKSFLVFDKDKHSESDRVKLESAFRQKLGIKTYIWKSYTLEAVLFSDLNTCTNLIELSFLNLCNYEANVEALKQNIHKKLFEIVENKQNEITEIEKAIEKQEKNSYKEIVGYFLKRKELLAKLAISDIIVDEDIILLNYIQEYKKILDIKSIHALMTKDDVFFIVDSIFKTFCPDFVLNKNTYFLEILGFVGYNTWFADWKNFVDNLLTDDNS